MELNRALPFQDEELQIRGVPAFPDAVRNRRWGVGALGALDVEYRQDQRDWCVCHDPVHRIPGAVAAQRSVGRAAFLPTSAPRLLELYKRGGVPFAA